MMKQAIYKLRCEYGNTPLDEEGLHRNPIVQFSTWLEEALEAEVPEPNGMTLATVNSAGRPSTRTVLLKQIDKNGFCFFTDASSRKGEHLNIHPFASLTFWWRELYRQVSIEGAVKRLTRKAAESYFYKRPRGAQIAALCSRQSQPLAGRAALDESYERLKKKYRGRSVPCPKTWVGFAVQPERVEFWQGRANRLHDRFVYILENGEWIISRLSP